MQVLNGFVKIHRKLIQWGWYQDNVVKGVFLHLLLTAAFQDGEWMGQKIKSGQVITSYGHLAEDLGFGVRQIRTAINKLKSTCEITSTSTSKYTIITIVNWEDYQCFDSDPTNSKTSIKTNDRQASDKQETSERQHRKNVKNVKNVKKVVVQPQLFEIKSFISENQLNVDAEKFFEHYENAGWKTSHGKNVTDWESLLLKWHETEKSKPSTYQTGYSGIRNLADED